MDTPKKKRRVIAVRRTELSRTPWDVHCIADLIKLAQTGKKYSNINTEMLWKITPQLIEIENLVGMHELKTTLFYQIIYYLQDLLIDESKEYLHTVIMGAPGSGKCLARGTNVVLWDGTLKEVQDITTDDILMGDDSTPRRVLSVCQGREDMFHVRTPTYEYTVNKSHVLSFIDASGAFIDLSITDALQLPGPLYGYKVSYDLEHVHQPELDPYVIGYCFAHLYQSVPSIRIQDEQIKQYLSSFDQLLFPSYRTFNYTINLSLFPMELFTSDVQQYMLQMDTQSQYLFLGGLFDACGRDDTLHLEHHTSTVLRLLDKLGIQYECTDTKYDLNDTSLCSLHKITVDTSVLPRFATRHTWEQPRERRVLLFPVDIEACPVDDYFGFELDGNHRFLLEDGTVTHNTTVAKLMGEMYKNMGILSPDGVFRVAKREDFVAEYLGQTAIKTKKLLDKCKGGVLFIDEVYALGPGKKDTDSFSKEAIDTLNVFLSENHDTFCCIIAGYEEDIKNCFFSVNKGLERRFQWTHRIGAYTSQDLVDIFFKLLNESQWQTDVPASFMLSSIDTNKDLFDSFGGAIENLLTKCKMAHAKRLLNHAQVVKHTISVPEVDEALRLMRANALEKVEQDNNTSYQHMYV